MKLSKLGGMTNTNYLLETSEGKFVVKVLSDFGYNGVKFVDRESELFNTNEVWAKTDLSYRVFESVKNLHVCDYMEGYSMINTKSADEVVEFAKTINKLHNSGCVFNNRVDYNILLDVYRKNITDMYNKYIIQVLLEEIRKMEWMFDECHKIIKSLGRDKKLYPCLYDTVPENVMINMDSDSKCKLIDWEYSGMSDRMWDLGNFATESDLSVELRDELLDEYNSYNLLSCEDVLAFMCYTCISNYLWSVWTVAKISQTDSKDEVNELFEYFMLRESKMKAEYNRYSKDMKLLCKELSI